MRRFRDNEKQAQLEQQLAEARLSAEQRLAALQKLSREFASYRRRMERSSAESATSARCDLLVQLLPVLDDLGRALCAAPPEFVDSSWTRGIFLIAKQLASVLNTLGVKRFGRAGTVFDPRMHEALSTQVRPDLHEGTIIQVLLPGYSFAGRMIRPAQVIVSIAG